MKLRLTINIDAIVARVEAQRDRERTLRTAGVAVFRDWKKRMTAPTDQSRLFFGAKPAAARPAHPGERLFDCAKGYDRYHWELRDHGPIYGVEAQRFVNGEFSAGRRFDPHIDPVRTPRELALAWAEADRRDVQADGTTA